MENLVNVGTLAALAAMLAAFGQWVSERFWGGVLEGKRMLWAAFGTTWVLTLATWVVARYAPEQVPPLAWFGAYPPVLAIAYGFLVGAVGNQLNDMLKKKPTFNLSASTSPTGAAEAKIVSDVPPKP